MTTNQPTKEHQVAAQSANRRILAEYLRSKGDEELVQWAWFSEDGSSACLLGHGLKLFGRAADDKVICRANANALFGKAFVTDAIRFNDNFGGMVDRAVELTALRAAEWIIYWEEEANQE